MKRRLLSLFLALTLLLSLCAPTAWALEPTSEQIKFVIDLTGYTGEVDNTLQYKPSGSTSYTPIPISPGQKNEFFLSAGDLVRSGQLTFTGQTVEKWTVLVNGLDDWEGYLAKDDSTGKQTLYYKKTTSVSSNSYRICSVEGNVFTLHSITRGVSRIFEEAYWGKGGQTVKITPTFMTSQYSLTAAPDDSVKGSVSATVTGADVYTLRATAGEGYSFDYWRNGAYDAYPNDPVYQIRENPYTTPALTQDAHYTAYFRKSHTPTVSASPAEAGTVSAKQLREDTWRLSASDGEMGYAFQCWNRDGYAQDDPVYRLTSPTAEVTLDGDAAYTAYYAPKQVTGVAITGAGWGGNYSSDAGDLPIYAGTRATVSVQIASNTSIYRLPNSHLAVYAGDQAAVEAGTAALLGQEDSGESGLGSTISVAVWPQGVERITAVAWTDGFEKHYDTMAVKTAAVDALDLTWLSSPQAYRTSAGSAINHPAFTDVAAFVDRQTGQPALYAAGLGGVFKLDYGGKTDLVPMAGLEDLGNGGDNASYCSYVLGVGGPDAETLTAFVKVAQLNDWGGADRTYELRRYDAAQGSWITVEGTQMPTAVSWPGDDWDSPVLVLDGDDVWTGRAHWDGAEWTNHDYHFTAFFQGRTAPPMPPTKMHGLSIPPTAMTTAPGPSWRTCPAPWSAPPPTGSCWWVWGPGSMAACGRRATPW
ncbi:InlB B-repeat-containing protein [Intestinimonas butyriciproducens]|uniref:InlB B-repeat-containing protein n=1 Tax=Intestinimonas butyriciproducens TaxID=1297617 RepID=UPI000951A779|nr:hypothetical protein [Intestinimonas butyriciproducens]OLR66169.1 hypothetical protein BIV19_00305 [Intestinimonas butyriciproducens]